MRSSGLTKKRAQELVFQEFGLRGSQLARDPDLPPYMRGYRMDLGVLTIKVAEVPTPEGDRFRIVVSNIYGLGSMWMYVRPDTLEHDTAREEKVLRNRMEGCEACTHGQ